VQNLLDRCQSPLVRAHWHRQKTLRRRAKGLSRSCDDLGFQIEGWCFKRQGATLEHLLPAAHHQPGVNLVIVEPSELLLGKIAPEVLGQFLGVGLAGAE